MQLVPRHPFAPLATALTMFAAIASALLLAAWNGGDTPLSANAEMHCAIALAGDLVRAAR